MKERLEGEAAVLLLRWSLKELIDALPKEVDFERCSSTFQWLVDNASDALDKTTVLQ